MSKKQLTVKDIRRVAEILRKNEKSIEEVWKELEDWVQSDDFLNDPKAPKIPKDIKRKMEGLK